MPAAEIRCFGPTVPWPLFAVFTPAHRAFCAAEMRRRAAADILRPRDTCGVLSLSEVSATIALSNRSRSCRNSMSICSRFPIHGF